MYPLGFVLAGADASGEMDIAALKNGVLFEFKRYPIRGCCMPSIPFAEFKALLVMQNRLLADLETRMKKYELSSTGFMALHAIGLKCGPRQIPITRADLAREIGVSPSSITVLMARMIEKGWVEQRDRDDRSSGLLLTAKGRSKLHGGMVAWGDAFGQIDSMLSATMKAGFLKAVTKINMAHVHRHGEVRRARLLRTYTKEETKKWARRIDRQSTEEARQKERALDES